MNYTASTTGKIEVRLDDPENGTQIGELMVSPSDGVAGSKELSGMSDLKFTKGFHAIYFVFKADKVEASASFKPSVLEFKFPENM